VTAERLTRGVPLPGAVAINVISMIGIGPLITIPLVLSALHGPLSLAGWLAGALLAICDGLVWAELGSALPGSGGTYGYLLAIFGRDRFGRLLAFLFVWQTLFFAPLVLASGYIGFANYAGYLVPQVASSPALATALAIGVGLITLFALYRAIATISRISVLLGGAALLTLSCIIVASYAHFSPSQAVALPAHDSVWEGLRAGLGQALIIAAYDYFGYNQANCIGDEIVDPARTLPRAIAISIALVAVLYVTMQFGVLGAVHWQAVVADASGTLPALGKHLASSIVEQAFGSGAASAVTVLILVTAFASVYGGLLGFSRIPYAAAVDGVFLRAFARVHPRDRFPNVSLLAIGLLALPACFFPLDQVINALTTGIVLIQSVAQIAALAMLRSRGARAPYRMWLYPLPALVALAGWIFLFVSAGTGAILFGIGTLAAGVVVFVTRAAIRREWPFVTSNR
jgi:amino acid transporter